MHGVGGRLFSVCLVLALGPGLVPACAATGLEAARDEQVLKKAGLATDGANLLHFVREQTRRASSRQMAELTRQLGDRAYPVRARATAALIGAGMPALPALRRALADPDVEVRQRAERCVRAIGKGPGPAVAAAAVRRIGATGPEGACAVLLDHLPWTDGAQIGEEVLTALLKVGVRGGKADAALTAAWQAPDPERRGAAALVLARAGTADQQAALYRGLGKAPPRIRLRVAQGSILAGDRRAVPVLIDLLGEGPLELAEEAENLLWHLAGPQSPRVFLGPEPGDRRRCREGWARWWAARGDGLALAAVGDDQLFRPALHAGAAVRRFLTAWVAEDNDALRRGVVLPFFLRGVVVGERRLANYLAVVPAAWKRYQITGPVTVRVRGVDPLPHFLQGVADPETRWLVGLPRPHQVQVVHVYSNVYRGAVFVRVVGGHAQVIGLGEARPPGDMHQ